MSLIQNATIIPSLTPALKELSDHGYSTYQRLYISVWDLITDYDVPPVGQLAKDYSHSGELVKDFVDLFIQEEQAGLGYLAYVKKWMPAVRDMVCFVAFEYQSGVRQSLTLSLQQESHEVLSELRRYFVHLSDDDYNWEGFETATNFESLSDEKQKFVDEFIQNAQNGTDLAPDRKSVEIQNLARILSRLSNQRQYWKDIMRIVVIDAVRIICANRPSRTQKKKSPVDEASPSKDALLIAALFNENEWQASGTQDDERTAVASPDNLSGLPAPAIEPIVSPEALIPGLGPHVQLFYRVLDVAADMPNAGYKAFIDIHGRRHLFDLLLKCVDQKVWTEIICGLRTSDQKYLLDFKQDEAAFDVQGWYLGVGSDSADQQFFKKYAGQSSRTIKIRNTQHRKTVSALRRFLAGDRVRGDLVPEEVRPPNHQLFHFVWARQATRTFKFIRLGVNRAQFDEESTVWWLNILETYFALEFQTLQRTTLLKFLEIEAVEPVENGLNVQIPLQGGLRNQEIPWTYKLLESSDPEVVRYAQEKMRYAISVARQAKVELDRETQGAFSRAVTKDALGMAVQAMQAKRATGWVEPRLGHNVSNSALAGFRRHPNWNRMYRDPRQDLGEPAVLRVYCRDCGTSRLDEAPVFHIQTGFYCSRNLTCHVCEPTPAELRASHNEFGYSGKARRPVYPVDGRQFIRHAVTHKWFRKESVLVRD